MKSSNFSPPILNPSSGCMFVFVFVVTSLMIPSVCVHLWASASSHRLSFADCSGQQQRRCREDADADRAA